MNKKLITLLTAGLIGINVFAQKPKIKPTGYIKLGYVPERTYFQEYKNQWTVEEKVGLRLNFKKFSLESSFKQTNFSKKNTLFFNPMNQKYTFDVELKRKNFSLFFNHYCFHPVDNESFYILSDWKYYKMNYTDLTEMGIKFEW